jgi:hypothetical protein
MKFWVGANSLRIVTITAIVLVSTSLAVAGIPVIDEDFSDDIGGGWKNNFGFVPQNVGKAGEWIADGYTDANGKLNNPDNDWSPLVQGEVGQPNTGEALDKFGRVSSGVPSLNFFGSQNREGLDTGEIGVYNFGGILKFQLADGTDRPAVTGDKIAGSFRLYRQNGNFGFGFTDDIAALQAYQATMPEWSGLVGSPIMMPTAYSSGDWNVSENVTGHMALNGGYNNLYTHAVVDIVENDGAGDGQVDIGGQGVNIPKVDPFDMIGSVNSGTPSIIHFEYTLGNSSYDVLQVDQGNGFEDIVQCNSQDCQADPGGAWGPAVPDPGGPMPVGRIVDSIEGMFITGGNGQLTEAWADDFYVEIVGDIPAVTGDYNENGTVDAADYTRWRDNLGTDNVLPNDNIGGTIDVLHYTQWNDNFGSTGGGSAGAAVPEPATFGLILSVIWIAASCRTAMRITKPTR